MNAIAAPTSKPQMAGMGQAVVAVGEGVIGALLGSCVGVVLFHRRLKLGALAHVVLPSSGGQNTAPGKFADTAIPHLVELLAREGANASGLSAKIAGGASMFGGAGPMQVGEKNILAVTQSLRSAGIPLLAQHVGGNKGRRMTFDVATGDSIVEIAGLAPTAL